MKLLMIDGTYRSLAIAGILLAANAALAIWLGNKAVRRAGVDVQLPDLFAAVKRAGTAVVASALLATAAQFVASSLDVGDTAAMVLFAVLTLGVPLPAFAVVLRRLSRAVAPEPTT